MERKTVLIADDDPVFVAAVSAVLQTRYDVRTAKNGTEALEQVAAAAAATAGLPVGQPVRLLRPLRFPPRIRSPRSRPMSPTA